MKIKKTKALYIINSLTLFIASFIMFVALEVPIPYVVKQVNKQLESKNIQIGKVYIDFSYRSLSLTLSVDDINIKVEGEEVNLHTTQIAIDWSKLILSQQLHIQEIHVIGANVSLQNIDNIKEIYQVYKQQEKPETEKQESENIEYIYNKIKNIKSLQPIISQLSLVEVDNLDIDFVYNNDQFNLQVDSIFSDTGTSLEAQFVASLKDRFLVGGVANIRENGTVNFIYSISNINFSGLVFNEAANYDYLKNFEVVVFGDYIEETYNSLVQFQVKYNNRMVSEGSVDIKNRIGEIDFEVRNKFSGEGTLNLVDLSNISLNLKYLGELDTEILKRFVKLEYYKDYDLQADISAESKLVLDNFITVKSYNVDARLTNLNLNKNQDDFLQVDKLDFEILTEKNISSLTANYNGLNFFSFVSPEGELSYNSEEKVSFNGIIETNEEKIEEDVTHLLNEFEIDYNLSFLSSLELQEISTISANVVYDLSNNNIDYVNASIDSSNLIVKVENEKTDELNEIDFKINSLQILKEKEDTTSISFESLINNSVNANTSIILTEGYKNISLRSNNLSIDLLNQLGFLSDRLTYNFKLDGFLGSIVDIKIDNEENYVIQASLNLQDSTYQFPYVSYVKNYGTESNAQVLAYVNKGEFVNAAINVTGPENTGEVFVDRNNNGAIRVKIEQALLPENRASGQITLDEDYVDVDIRADTLKADRVLSIFVYGDEDDQIYRSNKIKSLKDIEETSIEETTSEEELDTNIEGGSDEGMSEQEKLEKEEENLIMLESETSEINLTEDELEEQENSINLEEIFQKAGEAIILKETSSKKDEDSSFGIYVAVSAKEFVYENKKLYDVFVSYNDSKNTPSPDRTLNVAFKSFEGADTEVSELDFSYNANKAEVMVYEAGSVMDFFFDNDTIKGGVLSSNLIFDFNPAVTEITGNLTLENFTVGIPFVYMSADFVGSLEQVNIINSEVIGNLANGKVNGFVNFTSKSLEINGEVEPVAGVSEILTKSFIGKIILGERSLFKIVFRIYGNFDNLKQDAPSARILQ